MIYRHFLIVSFVGLLGSVQGCCCCIPGRVPVPQGPVIQPAPPQQFVQAPPVVVEKPPDQPPPVIVEKPPQEKKPEEKKKPPEEKKPPVDVEIDEPPTGGKLVPDAPREPLEPLSNPRGTIPVGYDGQNNPIRYAWRPSPVVAVSFQKKKNDNAWEVWNLQSLKKLGSVPGLAGAQIILSPDGAYLAMPLYQPGKIKASGLQIYTVADGQPLRQLKGMSGSDSRSGITEFAGRDQFLSVQSRGANGEAKLFDVKTGDTISTFETKGIVQKQTAALSPGGRYLAMYDSTPGKRAINIYEVMTGKLVRTIKPKLSLNAFPNAQGLTFSYDGKELAMLFSAGDDRLQAWDFATGRRTADHKFAKALGKTATNSLLYPEPLLWLPDGSGWIAYGQLLIDHKRGNIFWTIPPNDAKNSLVQRRLLDADHVVLPVVQGPRQWQLEITPLPKDEIAAARSK